MLKTLRPAASSASSSGETPTASKERTRSVEIDLANLFAQLEVEEPSESPLGKQPVPLRKETRVSAAALPPQLEDDIGSAFEIWCPMKGASTFASSSARPGCNMQRESRASWLLLP